MTVRSEAGRKTCRNYQYLLMYIYLQNISKSGQIGSSQHVLLLMPAVYLLENFAGMNFAHKIFKKRETKQKKKLIKEKFFSLKPSSLK